MKQYRDTPEYRAQLKYYNKIAKKADRMMRNLEKLSTQPGYKNVLKYAYAQAERAIESWTPPGSKAKAPRWQRNTPADTRTLKAKIKDIEAFISKPTATKRGIDKIYKKRAETINKKYGTNFTWQELAEFFDSKLPDKTFDKYGSKTVLIAIGKIQNNADSVVKKMQEHKPVHIKIDGDEKVRQTTNNLLHYYKKDLNKILN